ncbi:histone-lysine N-methyltransferase SETMAR-like [Agrilus planipennis]|uniref:Histone-lysine N-methyltransferase SETMAR-like n=1 Tax=Agrilus planipennis TaxID=224129 RepID=A0A1W4XAS9_AGRPL|nr:histone-lysine N-methyltransferase SETMAR-like [Agrilus planipennis]
MVNKEYYVQVMSNLREVIRQKRLDFLKNKNSVLHYDNASAYTSLLVHEFLAENNTLIMPQPPNSSDLATCDFFLFLKLKNPMKGRRYATIKDIKTASKEELNKITRKMSF